ncbi:hypothetical protein ACPXCG_18850 [Gordonia sp. DT218]|uniref:hypothetical protein n=1 Tax=Gordonia sp. DT218 TaxID=3416659 RepID=UPI003CF2AE6A
MQTISGSFTAGTYRLRYNPTTKTYTAAKYVGGAWSDLISWTDSSNVIAHGNGHRYGAIGIGRLFTINGGTIDNFYLRDWT